jgi:hypothetical protein
MNPESIQQNLQEGDRDMKTGKTMEAIITGTHAEDHGKTIKTEIKILFSLVVIGAMLTACDGREGYSVPGRSPETSNLLTACDGRGGYFVTGRVPEISNLAVTPQLELPGWSGYRLTVDLTFDFVAQDGNLKTITVNVYDQISGEQLSTGTGPIDLAGVTQGTIAERMSVSTIEGRTFIWEVFVTDSTGLESNRLTGSLTKAGIPSVSPGP